MAVFLSFLMLASVVVRKFAFVEAVLISSQSYAENSRKATQLIELIWEALQDSTFNDQVLFDMKLENHHSPNRILPLITKYIIKREVDQYRQMDIGAINRRAHSIIVMKLIDVAKDLPFTTNSKDRIKQAYDIYLKLESKGSSFEKMADVQVFHAVKRLFDVLSMTPVILEKINEKDMLSPQTLLKKLNSISVKPLHLAVSFLIQYHLRNTVNYAIQSRVLNELSLPYTQNETIEILKNLATRLLPVSELLDVHLAHSSKMFEVNCPPTWLGILTHSGGFIYENS